MPTRESTRRRRSALVSRAAGALLTRAEQKHLYQRARLEPLRADHCACGHARAEHYTTRGKPRLSGCASCACGRHQLPEPFELAT